MKTFILIVTGLVLLGCASKPPVTGTWSRPLIHGHRGSRGTHPENTLPAFKEALQSGVDVIELDLQLTRENIPVISHDSEITGKLCREPGGEPVAKPLAIRSLTLKEVTRFDCGSISNPKFPEQMLIATSPIPTLEEVLRWVVENSDRVRLNIETKMTSETAKELIPDPEEFVKAILPLLKKYKVVNRTILQSFDFRTLEVAKRLEPKLLRAHLFESENDFCQITHRHQGNIASPYYKLVNKDQARLCHELKLQLVPWTANDEGVWRDLLDVRVDGIITDYPRKLLSFLKANEL